jgi:hypothetical protein
VHVKGCDARGERLEVGAYETPHDAAAWPNRMTFNAYLGVVASTCSKDRGVTRGDKSSLLSTPEIASFVSRYLNPLMRDKGPQLG